MKFSTSVFTRFIIFFLLILLVFSCATSNQVRSNKLFQKRKYQKGWHVNSIKSHRLKNSDEQVAEKASEYLKETTPVDSIRGKNSSGNSSKNTSQILAVSHQVVDIKSEEQAVLVMSEISSQKHSEVGLNVESIDLKEPESFLISQESMQPPIDRSSNIDRFFLALLAIVFLFYFHISPLAILLALGKIESLKYNLIIWLLGIMLLAMGILMFVSIGFVFVPVSIGLLVAGFSFILAADIHALIVIIRGY